MERGWPGRGPWLIMATSGEVDWRIAAAVIAAAAEVPVALVMIGAAVAGDDRTRPHLAGLLEVPAADGLSLEQARDLVVAMSRAYPVVLVGGAAGPLVAVGEGGWNLADLGAAVRAPAVVVTGAGPDAVNHTTLALGALAGHGISASVVTIGEVDEAALPVTPAGRIPAEPPADLAGAADWLHPWLRPAGPPPSEPERPATVSGKRVVLALLAVFAVMVVVACGLAMLGGQGRVEQRIYTAAPMLGGEGRGEQRTSTAAPMPRESAVRRTPVNRCPENAGRITPTKPDAATTARVNAAWRRIEKWLAAHAPASLRTLRPGAPAARIDALQRRMSVPFPADLVVSLRRHDGGTRIGGFDLPPFFSPESLTGILGDWQTTCRVSSGADVDAWAHPWWDRRFVPFAADGTGGSLVVDQRPGGHGRVGEFYPEDGTSFERWPASVADFLELTATSLETGKAYEGRYQPRVDSEGLLDWEIR